MDSLGWRRKFGVIAPSTNTSVQPEFDDMRPIGVTNHMGRIYIPDDPVKTDADFEALMNNVRKEMFQALDRVMTCSPDYLVMGMSAETFWDGKDGSDVLKARVEEHCGIEVSMGSDACQAAIRRYGDVRRIAVLTPYMPVGDRNVDRFFTDCGFDVARIKGLCCNSPQQIAHVQPQELIDACLELDGDDVDCIVQVGTNLAFGKVAAEAERWLKKPVLAINTCTYWHALRTNGIDDKVDGYGSLLIEH